MRRYGALFVAILLLDRFTKWYALRYWCSEYKVTSFLSFRVILNRGISWGLLSSTDTLFFVGISSLITAVTVALIISAYRRYIQDLPIYGEILVIAGSCSNVFDRFWCGGVIDFILIHVGRLCFPVFNGADCFVVLGIFLMMRELWKAYA